VKKHPVIGYEICLPLRTMVPLLKLIRGHHERLDGRGYPDGLKGDEIPLPLRCLSVADVYDALTSDRSYSKRLGQEEAMRPHARGGQRRDVGLEDRGRAG
jgi:putative two-component system response regulator